MAMVYEFSFLVECFGHLDENRGNKVPFKVPCILNGTLYNAINSTNENTMTITANDLKTRGATIIEENLKKDDQVFVSIRGKRKYVVMDIEHYQYLRELELMAAVEEAHKDIAEGRYTTDSDEFFRQLENDL